jgi:DNA mismatch repair protein MutL
MIQILPNELIDRIAAGEVVERPAAVVKELVENALDAGATRIEVHLETGGKRLIKVTDNGHGIEKKDLEVVYLRHSTSKINRLEDLEHIASLGFRGEALASIGAVSVTRISSRLADSAEGYATENHGGRVSAPKPAGCPPGTTVEVRNLFYNVPPRLKFLKTDATELSHCVESVTRFALAYPEVAVSLFHNAKTVFKTHAGTSDAERIAGFFGEEVSGKLIPVQGEELGITFKGYLGKPELGRRDLRRSYLFLNGRFIKDKAVHAALRRAYREVMPEKLQPVYFLHLMMPPDWVDVNVHPTKIEVRFLDGARVFSAVYKAARNALAGGERAHAAAVPAGDYAFPSRPALQSLVREQQVPAEPLLFAGEKDLPSSKPFVQVHETYAVFETDEGLAIVDQHALHERILYERLRAEYETGGIQLQQLLVPVTVDLAASLAARMEEICVDMTHVGLRAEPFGPGTVKISAVPAVLRRADPHALAKEVVDRLGGGGLGEEAYQSLLHRMACRAAVKAGDRLGVEELKSLLAEAETIEFSGRCPHGRPTTVAFTRTELEELFKRRGF